MDDGPPAWVIAVACAASVVGVLCCLCLLFTSKVQSLLVFSHWLNWPPFDPRDLTRPSPPWAARLVGLLGPAFDGLPGAVPFSTVGPRGTVRGLRIPRAAPGHRVVLYLHGNARNVALSHRVELYKLLTAPPLCCDVVAIDYAGFGHSDGVWPDEDSAVRDVLAALEALPDGRSNIFVWGHSLGTGISVGAMARLLGRQEGGPAPRAGASWWQRPEARAPLVAAAAAQPGLAALGGAATPEHPRGLILESPFLSVPHAAVGYLSRCLSPRWLLQGLRRCLDAVVWAHRMPSHERIADVAARMPVAVLHGVQDRVIPFEQGRDLAALASAPLHSFDCGHEDIVRDPKLAEILERTFSEWENAA